MKTGDGEFNFSVDMGCGHPDIHGNSTVSIGCNGECEKCHYGVAKHQFQLCWN